MMADPRKTEKKSETAPVVALGDAPPASQLRALLRDAALALAACAGRLGPIADDMEMTNPRMHPIKFQTKDTWAREVRRAQREALAALERIPKLYDDAA